jgi:hypothetical protein
MVINEIKNLFNSCIVIPNETCRTHNRNRSLSFINSDQLANVDKGSRHNKPVTSGKRLALIVEYREHLINKYKCGKVFALR